MRVVIWITFCVLLCSSHLVRAESLRCYGDIIEVGDAKVDVFRKCGEPIVKGTYC